MTREAVLIFGTFNPVTKAHLALGRKMREIRPDADIIYVPSNQQFLRNWKKYDDNDVLSDYDRIRLLRKTAEAEGFFVDSLEVDGLVDGVTYHTINHFKTKYDNIYICMGMDKLKELNKWRHSDELISENKFLICTRDNCHIDTVASPEILNFIDNFTEVELDSYTQSISATQVRDACKRNQLDLVRDLIPDAVYDYLKNKN